MSSVTVFFTGLLLTAGISLAVVVYLNSHLKRILADLCGTAERAGFWTAFSNITLMLVPMIFAMSYETVMTPGASAVMELTQQLKWALIGMVISVLMLGIIISRFIPRASTIRMAAQH